MLDVTLSPTLAALLGFAGWTVLLVFTMLSHRTFLVFTGKRQANAWPRGAAPPQGDPVLMVRLNDAHQNCVENLPIFAAIALVAAALDRLSATDPFAFYVLAARVAQSITHLLGTSHRHVFVRATFFGAQLALFLTMVVALVW